MKEELLPLPSDEKIVQLANQLLAQLDTIFSAFTRAFVRPTQRHDAERELHSIIRGALSLQSSVVCSSGQV